MTMARRDQSSETLTILYPNGEREFWWTDRTFERGDVLERNSFAWVVVRIDDDFGRNESTVVVMPGDGDKTPEAA